MDSSDLQDYHNIYQEEFEARKLKPHNEDSLNFIGKQLNETRKIINNKLEFEKILKTCCLINYVNKKHTDYILKHKKIPIPLFKKEESETLAKKQIKVLTKEQIQALTEKQIQALKREQISWFTNEKIKNSPQLLLRKEENKTFNPEEINKYNLNNETLSSKIKDNSRKL